APFYAKIKEAVAAGEIGDIITMQTEENVSYHHFATAFVRGKWNSLENCGSTMLMQKCSHDMDLMAWLMNKRPVQVSSFGGLYEFREDRAPEGSGTRCLTDCAIEPECPYSARKMYLERGLWQSYVWENTHLGSRLSEEAKIASLKT